MDTKSTILDEARAGTAAALQAAAENAAKPGIQTTEFVLSVAAAGVGAIIALAIPGVGVYVGGALVAAVTAFYARSRSATKAAALSGAPR